MWLISDRQLNSRSSDAILDTYRRLFQIYPSSLSTYASKNEQTNHEQDDFVDCVELPGVKSENVSVEYDDNVLIVHANDRKGRTVHREWYVDPTKFDVDQIHAKLQDGLLTISIKKREEAKRKKITVKVE